MSINIMGHVKKPGTYKLKQNANILDIISAAGGVRNGAKLNKIILYRKNSQKIEINLSDLLKTGKELNIRFQPNDTIYIKPNVINTLLLSSPVINFILSIINFILIIDNVIL